MLTDLTTFTRRTRRDIGNDRRHMNSLSSYRSQKQEKKNPWQFSESVKVDSLTENRSNIKYTQKFTQNGYEKE